MTIKTAICNTKGGATKSGTTVSLAAIAAQRGLKVLVCDFDQQCTATGLSGFGLDSTINTDDYSTSRIIFEGIAPSTLAIPSPYGYDIIPGSARVYNCDDYIKQQPMGELMLAKAFNLDKGLSKYDLIICDTQGAGTKLVQAVIQMACDIIIPNQASAAATNQLPLLLSIIDHINEMSAAYQGLPSVTIRAHFFNNVRPPVDNAFKFEDEKMIGLLGDIHLAGFFVDQTTKAKQAEIFNTPLPVYDPSCKAVEKFNALFDRIFPEFSGAKGVAV